ncbi:MAG: RHS repeat-associated core domain-containing protein [Bacteroidia bacterium]|nr:RHS repeat-associated core domain-containing protein [Bacteroidia bacterium]
MIDFGNGHTLQYTYTADGRKLRERTKVSGQPDVKADYPLAGLYYRDNQLVYISTAEGRVLQTGASIDLNTGKVLKDFRYEYYLKDHLGNVRFLFTDVDGDGVPEILQEDAYDPWGVRLAGLSYTQGEKNRFLYNEKEQVKGLGWYDYGARMYDPATGRWNGVDGLAEKFSGWSSYHYVLGNPTRFADVDGNDTLVLNILMNHKLSTIQTSVYDVTFSLVSNGIWESIKMDKPIYMVSNLRDDETGKNDLPTNIEERKALDDKIDNDLEQHEYYSLKFDQMKRHNGDKGWENTIKITAFGVFLHPAGDVFDLAGCKSLITDFAYRKDKIVSYNFSTFKDEEIYDLTWSSFQSTVEALEIVRSLYNIYNKSLTGQKFLLKNNYSQRRAIDSCNDDNCD